MKKWNNPQLLNLMLQETKDVNLLADEERIALPVGNAHKCNLDRKTHDTWIGMISGHKYCNNNGHRLNADGKTCCTATTESIPPTQNPVPMS